MAFSHFLPLKSGTRDLNTANRIDIQLWQELVTLRYVGNTHEATGSMQAKARLRIDQAKQYFLDARAIHWRSAGLLYYYSLLNLASAYLDKMRPGQYTQTKQYHGLSADQIQALTSIVDYKITIHPSTIHPSHSLSSSPSCNLFAELYGLVTGFAWPFRNNISIALSDILAYCTDVGAELQQLFAISGAPVAIQSLIRVENNTYWLEMAVPETSADKIIATVGPSVARCPTFSDDDRFNWLLAFHRPVESFHGQAILRSPENTNQMVLRTNSIVAFEHHALHSVYIPSSVASMHWYFIPDIVLDGNAMCWRPVLSDYLVAFALSQILRYQPDLLAHGSKDSFLADAWCSQSPLTAVRHFLMLFTDPPLRIGQIA